jgi:SAM-dependent methyltransferase
MPEISKGVSKKIPIRERSVSIGNVVGINGYRVNKIALQQRFAEGGYALAETPHFSVFTRDIAPSLFVVHSFAPEFIDADVGNFLLDELKPLGLLKSEQDFGRIFAVVVGSLFPYEVQKAWHLYASNTLQHYQRLLAQENTSLSPSSNIQMFALLYRRVHDLLVGDTFLDAGCSFGFLPLLIATHFPFLTDVVGIDIQDAPFTTTRVVAEEHALNNVRFLQADLLADTFDNIGEFDTVTALHILEHFSEEDMYRVLKNLLTVTKQRVLIAVPYEKDEPEIVYGHKQLFSQIKLEAIGVWCVQQLNGRGRMWYEDSADGLLVVEKL